MIYVFFILLVILLIFLVFLAVVLLSGDNFYYYINMEGYYLSKNEFLDMVTEICVDYRRFNIYCKGDGEYVNASLLDHSRELYLTPNKIILRGTEYRLSLITCLRYLSFLKRLEKNVFLMPSSFLYQLNRSMKV